MEQTRQISREEFQTLYNVATGVYGNPYLAIEDDAGLEEHFLTLERLGLIRIEERNGVLYAAVETKAGADLLRQPFLKHWIPE